MFCRGRKLTTPCSRPRNSVAFMRETLAIQRPVAAADAERLDSFLWRILGVIYEEV